MPVALYRSGAFHGAVHIRDLSGAVALVTGADRPVPRATAIAVAARGASVVLAGQDQAALSVTQEAVEVTGGMVRVLQAADTDQTLAPIDEAADVFGRIDHAVFSLGLDDSDVQLALEDVAAFRHLTETRLLALTETIRVTVPAVLDAGGGTIVNVAALPGPIGECDPDPTLPVKLGVMGVTKGAAIEYAEEAVRVTALCPGFPDTPVLEEPSLAEPTARARVEALRPVDRFDDPAAVGAGVAALCAPGPAIGAPPAAASGS